MDNYIFPYNLVDKDSNVIIYGAGIVGRCFYKQLITIGAPRLLLWVDRDAHRYAELGYHVDEIDSIEPYSKMAIIVIAIDNSDVANEVKIDLLSRFQDLTEDRIIHSDNYWYPEGLSIKFTENEMQKALYRKRHLCANTDSEVSGEEKYNQESLIGRRLFNGKLINRLARVDLPVKDIILAQFKDHDYSDYQHCDMAVRYLAAWDIIRTGKINNDLYKRMQAGSGFDWTERYTNLVNTVYFNNFDQETVVELDKNLMIMDGSHRITLAYILGIEFIKADVYDCIRDRGFNIDFFWKKGFSLCECDEIVKTTNTIIEDCNYEFDGIIWPPAYGISDDIIHAISSWCPESVQVISYEDITYLKEDFYYLFRTIYYPDVLDSYGADQKFKFIEKSMGDECSYTIRRFRLKCLSPMISVNEKNYLPQSLILKRLKTTMRERFANKVKNYEYDIIMHISDNYLQSKFTRELFALNRDVSELFSVLEPFSYVVVKTLGRQHERFPNYYYYFGDVDIVVDENCFDEIKNVVLSYMNKKFNTGWQNISVSEKDNSVIIWGKILDCPIFGVDLQTVKYYDMIPDRNKWIISRAIDHPNGFRYLPLDLDFYFRGVELVRKPYKQHHARFLSDNRNLYSREVAEFLFGTGSDMVRKIEELII